MFSLRQDWLEFLDKNSPTRFKADLYSVVRKLEMFLRFRRTPSTPDLWREKYHPRGGQSRVKHSKNFDGANM
jgi:hypothetical protein